MDGTFYFCSDIEDKSPLCIRGREVLGYLFLFVDNTSRASRRPEISVMTDDRLCVNDYPLVKDARQVSQDSIVASERETGV